MDLGSIYDEAEQISAYVMFRVYSREKQPVAILLGSDDYVRLWLNGHRVFECLRTRVATADEDAVPAVLQSGWNTLLARVVNVTGQHGLYLRVSDAPESLRRVHRGPTTERDGNGDAASIDVGRGTETGTQRGTETGTQLD